MRTACKIAAGVLFLGLAAPTLMAQDQDVEGSKDHPLISRYPGSYISNYSYKEFDEYELPVGKGSRDNAGKTQRLEGKITHLEYRSPEGRSVLEIYRNFEAALKAAGFETLYSCSGVEQCGWGGFHFTPDVYEEWVDQGPTRHLTAKLSRPQGDAYVNLIIQRSGTAQTYLDVIEMKPMEAGLVTVNAESLAGDIGRTGHASVYGIYFDTGKADIKPESEATLKEIAKLLQQDANLKLYVVGHTDNVGTLASNMDLSKRRAAAVVQALSTKYGVAAARLHGEGVGPLSPVASNETEDGRAKNRRVELVKQ